MTQEALQQLYTDHIGKVSDKWEIYLDEYGRILNKYREKPVRLLEIGIQNGGSLEIWAKYFTNAAKIIGCDINPDCLKLSYTDPRIDVVVGDANTPETYASIIKKSPEFDIIIEDGSHLSGDIIKSFCLYFPSMVQGGTFIAEDLHCSYWSAFEGGLFHPYSSISFFKLLADAINFEHWGIDAPDRSNILSGILAHYDCEISPDVLAEVRSVEFINSICVVRKQSATSNSLGRRIIAGQQELVVKGHGSLHGTAFHRQLVPSQLDNPWATRALPPAETILQTEMSLQTSEAALSRREEEIRGLEEALINAQEALASTQARAVLAESANATMLQSRSWKLTAPMRWLADKARRLLR